jgi:HSP20 family protein
MFTTEKNQEEPRKYRRYHMPDIIRNIHLLSPYDLLRNLHTELEAAEQGHGHYIWGSEHPYRPTLRRINISFPHADIFDEGDRLRIALEIPGSSKDDIELDMEEDHFRIQARTTFEKCVEHKYMVHCEEREGKFSREISLPVPVLPEDAKASYKNDVLEIEVPKKRKESKRVKVAVE